MTFEFSSIPLKDVPVESLFILYFSPTYSLTSFPPSNFIFSSSSGSLLPSAGSPPNAKNITGATHATSANMNNHPKIGIDVHKDIRNPDIPAASLCLQVACSILNTFLTLITADITSYAVKAIFTAIPTPDAVSSCLAPDISALAPALAAALAPASAPASTAFLPNFSPICANAAPIFSSGTFLTNVPTIGILCKSFNADCDTSVNLANVFANLPPPLAAPLRPVCTTFSPTPLAAFSNPSSPASLPPCNITLPVFSSISGILIPNLPKKFLIPVWTPFSVSLNLSINTFEKALNILGIPFIDPPPFAIWSKSNPSNPPNKLSSQFPFFFSFFSALTSPIPVDITCSALVFCFSLSSCAFCISNWLLATLLDLKKLAPVEVVAAIKFLIPIPILPNPIGSVVLKLLTFSR